MAFIYQEIYLPFADATANQEKEAALQAARIALLDTEGGSNWELVCVTWTNGQLLAYFKKAGA